MSDRRWVSAHIFCQEQLDALLLELVTPLLAEIDEMRLADSYFFVRYWDGGRHLRLRLLPVGEHHAEIRRIVLARCAEYFRGRPARQPVGAAAYAEQAAQLARWEGVASYAERPYPTNTVRFLPYQPETSRYGGTGMLPAVERHFDDSSRLALGLIASRSSPAQRSTGAFAMILLSWLLAGDTDARPAGRIGPPAWPAGEAARRFRRQQQTLQEVAVRVRRLAAQPVDTLGSGTLADWCRSIGRLLAVAEERGAAARIVDDCAHLLCNRLGIPPLEEGYLRYLAARTLRTLPAER